MLKLRTLAPVVLVAVIAACSSAEERADKYLARAEASFEAGDLVKSELDAKNTLQIEPQNVEARMLLARIAESKLISEPDSWRQMMANLQRVIELQPDNIEARTKLIQLYLRFLGSPDKEPVLEVLREQLDAATTYAPENDRVLTLTPIIKYHEAAFAGDAAAQSEARQQAQRIFDADPSNLLVTSFLTGLYAAEDPDRALSLLDSSLQAKPQAALRILKIGLLQKLNRAGDAEQEYQALIDENPENVEIRYGLAQFYAENGRPDDAERLMREVVEARPDNVDARMRLATFVGGHKGLDAARSIIEADIEAFPEEWKFHFLLAELFLRNKQPVEAEAVYQNVIDKTGVAQPGLDARNRLARLRMAEMRKAEAQQYLEEVLAEDASNSDALMMRSAFLIERGDTDSAISDLRTVLRNDPTSRGGLLIMARAQSVAGNKSLAKESYQKLLAAHPDNVDGRRELARLLMRDSQWEEARGVLLSGVGYFPNDLEMTRMLVDTLVRVEDWQAAEVQANRIIQNEQTRALGHYLQGRISAARGELESSIESYKRAIDLEPKAIEPLTHLVRSYVQLNRVDDVLAYLERFQASNIDNVHSQTLIAEIYARKRNFEQAIVENDKALAINSRWVPAYRNLIGLHLLKGDLEAAEKASDGALEVLPDNADLRMLRATVYERQSRWDEAIAVYETEIERNPDLDVAVNNYAALVADHRQDPQALGRALQLAQRFRNSDNPIFLDTLGWLLYRTGDFEDAVKVLEASVEGASQVPQLRYHLGMAYFELDRLDMAKTELQAAVSAQQPYTGLEKARETLELL